jgi:hypothetical protein
VSHPPQLAVCMKRTLFASSKQIMYTPLTEELLQYAGLTEEVSV